MRSDIVLDSDTNNPSNPFARNNEPGVEAPVEELAQVMTTRRLSMATSTVLIQGPTELRLPMEMWMTSTSLKPGESAVHPICG